MKAGDGLWGRKLDAPALLDQNQGDYATQIGKALGIQGRVPAHVDPRVQLGITLDDFAKPEFAILRRNNLWQGRATTVAVAAQFQFVQLSTVANIITAISRVIIHNPNAAIGTYRIGFMNLLAGGAAGSVAPKDDRNLFSVQPAASILQLNSASVVAPLGSIISVLAGQSVVLDVGYVGTGEATALGVAQAFTVKQMEQNSILDVQIDFSERVQLDTEK